MQVIVSLAIRILKIIGLAIVYGITAAFVVVYPIVLVGSIYQLIVYPDQPARVTLAEAVEMDANNKPVFLFVENSLYLTVTDAAWECASVTQAGYRDKKHTDGVFTDKNNTAIVFVQIQGYYTCQELQSMEIAGELQSFVRRPVEYQSDNHGPVTIDENSDLITLSLCTHCDRFESLFGVVFFLAFPFIMWGIFYFNKLQQSKLKSDAASLMK